MEKKWMAFLAWLLLACGCLGCAPGFYGAEPLLDAETAGRILGIYEEEVRMVEETFGEDLSDYTAEDDEILTEAAIAQYGTEQFDRLSQLVTELTAAAWNQSEESGGGEPPAYTIARPFGPIKGACFWEVPVAVSLAGDLTGLVEISRGDRVQELKISNSVSVEIPLEQADGPSDGTHLANGKAATHRVFTGVLWGVILEGPGEAEYRVARPRGAGYAHLAQISSPLYVERAGDHAVVTCEHFLEFQQTLERDPGRFLS